MKLYLDVENDEAQGVGEQMQILTCNYVSEWINWKKKL